MKKIQLGLLDFGQQSGRTSALRIITDLIDYSVGADQLGYSRIWLAEHYFSYQRHAWNSPKMLIPIIAGMTERINVGTAGILLSIHNPFHTACDFKLLANLFPGRIDLGLANGRPGSRAVEYTIGKIDEDLSTIFNRKFKELIHFLTVDEVELMENGIGVVIPPFKGKTPEIWSLSASYESLGRVIDNQTNFCRSIFHMNADISPNREKLEAFRENYRNKNGKNPKISMAVSGYCHTNPRKISKANNLFKNDFDPKLIGSPNKFHDTISHYSELYGIDEIIFMNLAGEVKDRMLSIEKISDVFGLTA
ncbi:hypothetical protein GCM10011514_43190 [Emticicia aquatilis]|uniref:Luciferase-like domain-containing protein n=1 Tax=Emticicia aquatilis TaxID=1537369 RepID=A0A916Z3U4_9BACT|nr:LLM class flavin-dependent oxidoreductase [Emticicia aquatilis]GGD74487.1 hypothetical protein GCM10011514_43190 [Emticicia aquatilis]